MGDKVLAVDDELQMRDLLNLFLTRDGYEVILASNGEDALKLAQKENPQIILLDIKMPGIDGIEVCRRLKANRKTQSIPIIVITALGDHKMEAIEAGADDFISKPLDMLELSTRVKSIIRISYLSNELKRVRAYISGTGRADLSPVSVS